MTSYNIINHLSFYMKNKYAKIFTVKKRSSFLPKWLILVFMWLDTFINYYMKTYGWNMLILS